MNDKKRRALAELNQAFDDFNHITAMLKALELIPWVDEEMRNRATNAIAMTTDGLNKLSQVLWTFTQQYSKELGHGPRA